MNRRSVSLVMGLACALVVVSPVNGQRSGRARSRPAAAPISLAGSPARSFPAETMFYAEISDAASVVDQMGGVELLYRLIREGLRNTPSTKSTPFPLTEQQFRQTLGSNVALGMLLPPQTELLNLGNVDPTFAGIVQSSSPEVALLVQSVMKEAGRDMSRSGGSLPKATTVRGARVSTWGTGRSAFAVTQVGNDFVFGDPTGVKTVLDSAATPPARSLAELPSFKGANERVPGRRQFFAFVNGAPVAAAFNAGIDQSYAGMRPAPAKGTKSATAEPSVEAAALKRFIGMDALVGGSVTALAESGQATLQAALELDRTRHGLVGVLTDPPIIEGRSSNLMPNDTDGALMGSVDFVRIYDLILQTLTPELSKKMGIPPPPEMLREFETKYELRLRDDFLAAFGNEFAIGLRIEPEQTPALMARVQDDGTPPPAASPSPNLDDAYFMMELRNPTAIRQFLDKTFTTQGENPTIRKDTYRDIELWNETSFTFAIVGDFLVGGERKMVEEIIVSFQTEQGLMKNSDYLRALGGMPNNAIGVLYVSPDFISMAGKLGGLKTEKPLYPQSLLWTLQKDGSGIYTNFQAPLPDMRNLFETGTKLALLEPDVWPGFQKVAAPQSSFHS